MSSSSPLLYFTEPLESEMEAIMEKPLLASSSQEDDIEDFSEWRLFLVGSRFDAVGVNDGFQIRDFQTSQGTSIIVDPEPYRKLQNEASAIWTKLSQKQAVLLFVLYLSVMFQVVWFDVLEETVEVFMVGWFLSLGLALVVFYFATQYLQKNADSRITAVVDSYKEHFLKAYGIELGYGKLNRSAQGRPKVLFRAIYLRRPRMLPQEEVLISGDLEVQDEGELPPIFINLSLPGDIHVNEKVHDVSMKVDAETWTLLQSVHQKMVQTPPFVGFLFLFYVMFVWYFCFRVGQNASENGYGYVSLIITWASIPVTSRIIDGALDYRNLRVYEEVTCRVNEALQRDEKRAHLAVEFHHSDLPGRVKTNSRRYQFVRNSRSPKKEIV